MRGAAYGLHGSANLHGVDESGERPRGAALIACAVCGAGVKPVGGRKYCRPCSSLTEREKRAARAKGDGR